MDINVSWYIEKQIERTANNLRKHNMDGFFVKDDKNLIELLRALIVELFI